MKKKNILTNNPVYKFFGPVLIIPTAIFLMTYPVMAYIGINDLYIGDNAFLSFIAYNVYANSVLAIVCISLFYFIAGIIVHITHLFRQKKHKKTAEIWILRGLIGIILIIIQLSIFGFSF